MLQYVTTKLGTQKLDGDSEQDPRENNQVDDSPDSGTETDDETGGPDDDFPEMDYTEERENVSSSRPETAARGFTRSRISSTPVSPLCNLELCDEGNSAEQAIGGSYGPVSSGEKFGYFSSRERSGNRGFRNYIDNDGNHSSEEELEEINNKVDFESDFVSSSPALSVSQTSRSRSGDEILNTLEIEVDPPPVEFSTSPPVHVHRPRRSLSPPSKIFSSADIPELAVMQSGVVSSKVWTGATGVAANANIHPDVNLLPGRLPRERRAISPKKRYKQSRIHHIQRPCLDFEKMQQLKTRAVTSWRHGGELSLFCW